MNDRTWLVRVALGMATCVAFVGSAWAKDEPKAKAKPAEPPVAAYVNREPIYIGEVDLMVQTLGKSPQTAAAAAYLRAEALDRLITMRLGEIVLARDNQYIKPGEVEKGMASAKSAAESNRMTLEQFAASRKVGVSALRHDVAWNIGWDRYREMHLNASLESYFKEHHRHYDGTTVRASHILLRPERANATTEQLIELAKKIRADLADDKIAWDEAVKKYSAGPSRTKAGDLGFFPRHGVMNDEFSKMAFGLEVGEVGQPVSTIFGVHLIKVTEVKDGTKQWTETIDQLTDPATMELFDKLASEERGKAKIEFTGNSPYFKPGTKEMAIGGPPK
jgi:parvulin-like peptidyl-prolyl isomerase